jgi:hypothetical protein
MANGKWQWQVASGNMANGNMAKWQVNWQVIGKQIHPALHCGHHPETYL